MLARLRPCIAVLTEIPDCCRPRGQRHPLAAILVLACSAMLCRYRSYPRVAEWGRTDGARLTRAMGFAHLSLCAAALHTVLRRVDQDMLEAKLGAWAE
jgi:hypothetical protein